MKNKNKNQIHGNQEKKRVALFQLLFFSCTELDEEQFENY